MRLKDEDDIAGNIADAIYVAKKAISQLQNENKLTQTPPSSCDEPSGKWDTGELLYE